jgi:polyisoprenoid-binding protein YceI
MQESFFHAEKYPLITFESTAITKVPDGFLITEQLTIKGVTRTVSFPFSSETLDGQMVFTGLSPSTVKNLILAAVYR